VELLETESDEMPDGKEQPDTGAEERNEAGVPGPRRVFATLKTLGPGLVAGASDIDPTTVVTMAVVGATTIYALCAQFDVRRGLSEPVRDAPTFYGVITTSTLAAIVISAIEVPPIRLLFLASIVAGVATPIGLSAMMLVTSDPRLMGARTVRAHCLSLDGP
jgi:Mn2+/Fe2+ NRAMP family transporter